MMERGSGSGPGLGEHELGHLRATLRLAERAKARGDDPFGAVLGGGDALPIGCRNILARGSRRVEVVGPVLEEEGSVVFGSSPAIAKS